MSGTGYARAGWLTGWSGGRLSALQTVAVGNILIQIAIAPVAAMLPTIGRDLGAGVSTTGWVMSAFLLTLTGCMLLAGRLGDLFGHRRAFLAGILVSTVAGTGAGLAPSLELLLGLRALHGLGGALILGNGLAILTDSFPENQRGRAIGITGMAAALGSMLGTFLSTLALDYLSWHWFFAVNLPLGLIGALSALGLSDANARTRRAAGGWRRLDWAGAVLLLGCLTAFSLSLSHLHEGPETFEAGWEWHLTMHAVAGALLVAFVLAEARVPRPIVDLGQFRNGLFSTFLIAHGVLHMTMMGQFFLLPFLIERGMGLPVSAAGQFIAATQAFNVVTSLLGGWIYDKTRSKLIVVYAMLTIATSLVLQGLLGADLGYLGILAIACLASFGMGFFQTANNVLIMGAVEPEQRGFASGMIETVRQLGHGVGIAVSGAVVAASTGGAITAAAQAAAYVEGFQRACLLLGAIGFAAAFLSWLGLRLMGGRPGSRAGTQRPVRRLALDRAEGEPVTAG